MGKIKKLFETKVSAVRVGQKIQMAHDLDDLKKGDKVVVDRADVRGSDIFFTYKKGKKKGTQTLDRSDEFDHKLI